MPRSLFVLILLAGCCLAEESPAYALLSDGYRLLQAKSYGRAVALFEKALLVEPGRTAARKDLAYAYLKIGEREKAREHFRTVAQVDPKDEQAALEYAFLAYETGQRGQALRMFRQWKEQSATAARTFQSLDQELAAGIARWSEVVGKDPRNMSAHQELARLAEERGDLTLAATHFRACWDLRPDMLEFLFALGRVWSQMPGKEADSVAAYLAVSRSAESYMAEKAKAELPGRYPYVYEFDMAITLHPANRELQHERAYLLLAMGRRQESIRAFHDILRRFPDDEVARAQIGLLEFREGDREQGLQLLKRVLEGQDQVMRERVAPVVLPALAARDRELGLKSLQAGYLKDAVRLLTSAYENNPRDYEVMLKLGWAHNMLKQDEHAVEWFRRAAGSPDPKVSREASRAYRNLNPPAYRITVWALPMYASRWSSAFGYGQAKVEPRKWKWPVRPYVSVRLAGDSSGNVGGLRPQYLSESSIIPAIGVSTKYWHGLVGWAEAGIAINYLPDRKDLPRTMSDYRAGLSYSKGWGNLLDGESKGWFADTANDLVFLSRFQNSTLLVTQNRAGYTWQQAQAFWSFNWTGDTKQQAWANFTESGPGVRVRLGPRAHVTAGRYAGHFLLAPVQPFGRQYSDYRVRLWYAFTR